MVLRITIVYITEWPNNLPDYVVPFASLPSYDAPLPCLSSIVRQGGSEYVWTNLLGGISNTKLGNPGGGAPREHRVAGDAGAI